MEIKVKLFGAMRQYHNKNEITIAIKKGSLVKEVRKKIGEKLEKNKSRVFDKKLLKISAIADEKKILYDYQPINQKKKLSILPPVSGGWSWKI